MPNKKISELSAAGALAGNELVEVVKGGANVQTTTQDIANLAPGGGGGGSWGSITGTLSNQTDLQNALNDKADAGVTIVTDTGAYTLQASDLTLINAGATLIIDGDGTGDLTVPLNATVAFPIGTMIGVRDYDNVVATGGVTITGSAGDLAIPSGMTATLEKTGTNTWLLHNGSAVTGGGSDLPAVSRTGTSIKFDAIATYGYTSAETGSLTLDTTDFVEGMTQLLIHNDATDPFPTSDPEFKIIYGEYETGVTNYILLHAVKTNLILVTISQVQL